MPLLSKHISGSRYARILPHVAGDVLDIGCQQAQVLEAAAERIDRYVGIDIDEASLEIARARHPEREFVACDVDQGVKGFSEEFDSIVLCAVIEHLFNQKVVFESLAQALKPGGRILLTTPTPLGNDVVHRIGSAIGLFSKLARDDHIMIYNKLRFEILAREVGLEVEQHDLFQVGCNQFVILRKPLTA